jgi:membrane-bound ClpP family serine protease
MVLMLIGTLCLIWQISKTSPAIIESALLQVGIDPLGAPAALTVTGRELHIDGHLTINLAEAFTALINKHPNVTQISMTSPGGRIDTAVQIASIISERKLNTVVVGECSSACTIIFLSGKTRMFDIDATLGFHSPSVLGLSDTEARVRSPEVTDVYEAAGPQVTGSKPLQVNTCRAIPSLDE